MGLALDELKEEEKIHTINEIDLMIEENVMTYTEDNQIDYVDNEQGQGFSIAPLNGASCC